MFARINHIRKPISLFIALSVSGLAYADKGSYQEDDLVAESAESAEQMDSILNPESHPATPEARNIFPDSMAPIDATLSWTERFNGDETFSDSQSLTGDPGAMMMVSSSSKTHMMDSEEKPSGMGQMDSTGTIKGIKPDQDKIKIAHGPIEKYGMPAMTMMFKVSDPVLLDGLEKGAEVEFNVESTSGGFVVIGIMPAGEPGMHQKGMTDSKPGVSMDAEGTIQQIRLEQGKVKIAHGPIEKFGMPEMAMVFKVSDPSMLEGLEKGTAVRFSVDNSSGGFVITAIEAINR